MPDPPMMPRTDAVTVTLTPSWPDIAPPATTCRSKLQGRRRPAQGLCSGPPKAETPCACARRISDRCLLRILAVRNFPRHFNLVPHLLLGEVHETREHDQEDHDLEADALTLHQVRLGRPHQEGSDVLGILIHGLWRAIIIGDLARLQRRRHRNVMAREISIVVAARWQQEALRRLLVSLQERRNVIRSLLLILCERVKYEPWEAALKGARFCQCGHIGRRGTPIGGLGGKFVGKWRREGISEPSRSLGRLTLIVEILDLVLGRHRRRLTFAKVRPPTVGKVSECQHLNRMAGRTDLFVDFEAALQLRLVIFSEWPGEGPF